MIYGQTESDASLDYLTVARPNILVEQFPDAKKPTDRKNAVRGCQLLNFKAFAVRNQASPSAVPASDGI